MILNIAPTGVSLDEIDDFRRFKVAAAPDLELSAANRQGLAFEGEHCWIDVDLLKRLAGDPNAEWIDSVDRMAQGAANTAGRLPTSRRFGPMSNVGRPPRHDGPGAAIARSRIGRRAAQIAAIGLMRGTAKAPRNAAMASVPNHGALRQAPDAPRGLELSCA